MFLDFLFKMNEAGPNAGSVTDGLAETRFEGISGNLARLVTD
jgi:hypothetical protein